MVVLLFGKERFLKDEAVSELKSRLFKVPSELELNFQAFDGAEGGAYPALDFLATAPFLGDKRLALLRNVEELSDEEGEKLLVAIGRFPSSANLILETSETNTRKNAFLRELSEKAGTVTPCHPPFERDLLPWIEARARKKGLTLDRGVSAMLAGRVGANLAALDGVLDEIKLYVHPKLSVTVSEAAAISPSNPEEDIFKLIELILEDKKKEALTVVDGLLRSGAKAPEIVGALAGQIERYKRAQTLLSAGRSLTDIGEEMRIPRPFQQAFFQRLKRSPRERLTGLQKALLDCDESFKTGRSEERVSIERFVLLT